jgi:hypothetical protein
VAWRRGPRLCAVDHRREEEEDFFFFFSRNGIWAGSILGRAGRPSPGKRFFLFFCYVFLFFFLFSVLNFNSDFKPVLQVLDLGIFLKFSK